MRIATQNNEEPNLPKRKTLSSKLSQNLNHFYNWVMDNVYFNCKEDIFPNFKYKFTL